MQVRDMISTHPQVQGEPDERLLRAIEACYACAQTCTSCADACLGEEGMTHLTQCIRRNLDCADLCGATGAIVTRRTGSNVETIRAALDACVTACRICAEECESHASMHAHCRICAEACRACEAACQAALGAVR